MSRLLINYHHVTILVTMIVFVIANPQQPSQTTSNSASQTQSSAAPVPAQPQLQPNTSTKPALSASQPLTPTTTTLTKNEANVPLTASASTSTASILNNNNSNNNNNKPSNQNSSPQQPTLLTLEQQQELLEQLAQLQRQTQQLLAAQQSLAAVAAAAAANDGNNIHHANPHLTDSLAQNAAGAGHFAQQFRQHQPQSSAQQQQHFMAMPARHQPNNNADLRLNEPKPNQLLNNNDNLGQPEGNMMPGLPQSPQINWGKCPELEPSEQEKLAKANVITKCLETTPLPVNITRESVEQHREQIAACALRSEGWFTASGGYDFGKAEKEIKNKRLQHDLESQVLNYHSQCKVESEEKYPSTNSSIISQIQLYQACMDYFISDVCGIEVNDSEGAQF